MLSPFAYSFIHLADVLVQRNFAPSSLAQHMQAQISCDVFFVSKCSDNSGVTFGILPVVLLSLCFLCHFLCEVHCSPTKLPTLSLSLKKMSYA